MKDAKKVIKFIYEGDEELISLQDLRAFRKAADDIFSEPDRLATDALIDTLEKAGGDEYKGEIVTLKLGIAEERKLRDIKEIWTLGIEAAVEMVCDMDSSTIEELSQSMLGERIESIKDLTLSQAKAIVNKRDNGIEVI